jgi:hypothetical protein
MKKIIAAVILILSTIFTVWYLLKVSYFSKPIVIPTPMASPTLSPIQSPLESPVLTSTSTSTPIATPTISIPTPLPSKNKKATLSKGSKITLKLAENTNELLKNSTQLKLSNNEEDQTVSLAGLWRGEIKISKEVSYSLIINRPWDYLTDEYLASSCTGIEEPGDTVYQKSLYNTLKFFEAKTKIKDKEVHSLVGVVGDKYVINVALPASEEITHTNGIAYLKHGQNLEFLGEVELNKDTEYPKSDCTDFEHKL